MNYYYLGLEDENGLTIVQQLTKNYAESKAIVDQRNADMSTTAYSLVGGPEKDPGVVEIPSGVDAFSIVFNGQKYTGILERMERSQDCRDILDHNGVSYWLQFNETVRIELKCWPKIE